MADRAHYLDASRAIVMFLGVPFHTFRLYDEDSTWVLSLGNKSPALSMVARFLHTFRLPVFFVLAGYFSLVLVERWGAREWMRTRLVRLGIPLVSSALLLNPIQEVIRHRVALGAEPGWGKAAALTLQGLTVPGAHLVHHLWFLIDLLALSAGFAAIWLAVSPDAVSRVAAWIARRFAAHPLPAALVSLSMLGVYNLGVFGSVSLLGGQSVVFYDILDLPGIAGFAPFFALGVLLAKRPDLLASFVRASRTAVALALGAALAMALAPRQGLGAAGKAMTLVAFPIVGVLMTHALFSWTHRFLDRSNGVIRVLADSSFTMYLVHQPIIVALGFLFLGVAMSPIAGATIIVAVATGASIAAHRLIATRPALLFLFNGVRRRPAPETVA